MTQPLPTVTPQKKRGRPPKATTTSSAVSPLPKETIMKPPGHPQYPQNDFSLTVSKTKGDIERFLLDTVHDFICKFAIKGGVATEVGHRAHNLHLQSMFTMRFPKEKTHLRILTKLIKDLLKPLTGYKVFLKPFAKQQHFSAMVGYITKDQGKKSSFCLILLIHT